MTRHHFFACLCAVPLAAWACSDGTVVGGSTPGTGGRRSGDSGADTGGTAGSSNAGAGGASGAAGASGGSSVGGTGNLPVGHSVGEACTATDGCRPGLTCTAGQCEFGHAGAVDAPCIAAGECEQGLQCVLGTCTAAGTAAEGEGCTGDAGCQAGLRCGIVGFGAQCVPEGTADVGQDCTLSADCYGGLICAPGTAGDGGAAPSACVPIPATGPGAGISFGIPVAPSLACERESSGRVKAHFEVPGADGTDAAGDFFRLPFPNDARIVGGRIDLTGFPTPGSFLLGFDPVQAYVDAIEATETAWGTYAATIFRFSGPIDFDTFRAVSGQPSPVQYLDITDPANPGNGGAVWGYSPGGGKYVCHNWIGVRRHPGSPLEPGHTYVVYLSTVGKDTNGLDIERGTQFTALLAAAAPSDAGLARAYAAYKPFRDYLAAANIAPATILNAAVFTAGQVRKPMEDLAAAVATAPAPTAAGWVKCGGAATSPCPQATGERACGAANADYDEYHALLTLPIFQRGTAPYATAGGDIDTTAPVRTEEVCAALSVPKGTAPGSGWPLAVFGHGSGGSFRSHLRPEVAGALATATTPMAVLGYDQVQHGPRRGASTASPNVLFFNFRNPLAARGNPLQGAADVLSVGRLVGSLTVPGSVTGGAAVSIDPAGVVYFGHSQGAMHGSLGLPYTNDYSAAVLSGNGASLMHALLTKTAPENIARAVPFALGGDYDGNLELFGGDSHPVLGLLQQWIDPADPLNFAITIGRDRPTGITPKSILQTYGLGDTYSPPVTMNIYANVARFQVAAHHSSVTTPDDIAGGAEQPVPLSGNFANGGETVTMAVRQYQNAAGRDGHFVAFDVPGANQDVVRFLSMAAAGQIPVVGQ